MPHNMYLKNPQEWVGQPQTKVTKSMAVESHIRRRVMQNPVHPVSSSPPTEDVTCDILLDSQSNWPVWPPVVTDGETGEFVYPTGNYYDSDRAIRIPAGSALDLGCPWTGFADAALEETYFVTAECVEIHDVVVRRHPISRI